LLFKALMNVRPATSNTGTILEAARKIPPIDISRPREIRLASAKQFASRLSDGEEHEN
jgi:hypothetical protein